MRLRTNPYSLLMLCLVILASCSKKTNVPVPVDAGMVLHIDGKSLHSKLSWDEFKQGELYKIASETMVDSLARQILDNPENTGIDIQSDAFLFTKIRGRGGYVVFTGNIKDEKKFNDVLTKASGGEKEITKQGNLSVLKISSQVILTWDGKRFVFIGDTPELNSTGGFGMEKNYSDRKFGEDSLVKFASEVYDIKGDKGAGSDSRFASMMKEEGDAHFWVNAGAMYGGSLPSVLALTKISTLIQGNATAATLKFDNGKITMDGKHYYNKELNALVKKHSSKQLDESMLRNIASDNVALAVAFNYPPEGLRDFLVLLGLDGLVNLGLADIGYSVDEFIKANKGDVMLAVTDFSVGNKTMTMGTDSVVIPNKPEGKILFATSVNDRPSFEKMITLLHGKLGASSEVFQQMSGKIPYQLKDKWFVAGSDSGLVNAFGATPRNHNFISQISGHPFGGYVDIQKFINGSLGTVRDSSSAIIAAESAKFWKDIVFYGGEYKDEATISHAEINLVDKSTNSLKQLNKYLGVLAKSYQEKRKARMWDDMPPPPPPAIDSTR
jgi:hypothetical protein